MLFSILLSFEKGTSPALAIKFHLIFVLMIYVIVLNAVDSSLTK